jgi:ABC-type siderophore export system fused ATPase/permease subunit
VLSENPAANNDLILAADSDNRVALEYKLALLFLQKNMQEIAETLPTLQKAGYTQIPKNVEEAAVAYSLLNLKKYPEFEGITIRPETVIRFNEYYKIFQQNNTNKEKAQNALKGFSETFWYYVFFR